VQFENLAWLSEDTISSLAGLISVVASPDRDISSGVGSASAIHIRDLQLKYPGGGVTVIVPIKELVVEYRPTTGVVAPRMTLDKKSRFNNGYLVTYASIGMPESVYQVLTDKIRPYAGGDHPLIPKARVHSGYVWLPVKVPDARPINIWVQDEDGKPEELGTIVDFFKAIQQSMIGSATLAFRLKRIAKDVHLGSNEYELAATLTAFQPTDVTELQSPPLNNQASKILVRTAISSRLAGIIAEKRAEEEAEAEGHRIVGDDLMDDVTTSLARMSPSERFRMGIDHHSVHSGASGAGVAGSGVRK